MLLYLVQAMVGIIVIIKVQLLVFCVYGVKYVFCNLQVIFMKNHFTYCPQHLLLFHIGNGVMTLLMFKNFLHQRRGCNLLFINP